MSDTPIASELSYLVMLKRQAEQAKKDAPKVKADAEKPAKFDAYPVRQSPVVWL